jgi:ABC-2 type transport system ATP-binding protein
MKETTEKVGTTGDIRPHTDGDHTLAIQASELARQFGQKVAVNNIDLAIQKGEVYGFLDLMELASLPPFGCWLPCLLPPRGNAWVMGYNISDDVIAARLCIGVALQDLALDEQQTGAEFLRLQGRLYGLSFRVHRRVGELAELRMMENPGNPRKTFQEPWGHS